MKRAPLVLGSAIISVIVGCSTRDDFDDVTTPIRPGVATRSEGIESRRPFDGLTLDQVFERIDELSPGFAGYYRGTGDSIIILHRANPAVSELLEAVRGAIGDNSPPIRAAGVRILPVQYGFRELMRFRTQLEEGDVSGWVTSDVDELYNRVRIGVESDDIAHRVRESSRALSIPENALSVVREARPEPMAYLSARFDTTKAGQALSVLTGGGYGGGYCTIGFNYTLWSSTQYFMTNGHCSYAGAGNGILDTNVKASQQRNFPFPFPDEARQVANPAYTSLPGCPVSTCRYSDAAGFRWQTPQVVGLGKLTITRFDGYGWYCCGDTLVYATLNFTSEIPNAWMPLHEPISRLGHVAGWTSGEILQTCLTHYLSSSALLCQFRTDTYTEEGDSGGPVFTYSNNTAALGGILHTASPLVPDPAHPTTWPPAGGMIFSTITGIQLDFGSLKTYPAKP